jgi:hypothetical protein
MHHLPESWHSQGVRLAVLLCMICAPYHLAAAGTISGCVPYWFPTTSPNANIFTGSFTGSFTNIIKPTVLYGVTMTTPATLKIDANAYSAALRYQWSSQYGLWHAIVDGGTFSPGLTVDLRNGARLLIRNIKVINEVTSIRLLVASGSTLVIANSTINSTIELTCSEWSTCIFVGNSISTAAFGGQLLQYWRVTTRSQAILMHNYLACAGVEPEPCELQWGWMVTGSSHVLLRENVLLANTLSHSVIATASVVASYYDAWRSLVDYDITTAASCVRTNATVPYPLGFCSLNCNAGFHCDVRRAWVTSSTDGTQCACNCIDALDALAGRPGSTPLFCRMPTEVDDYICGTLVGKHPGGQPMTVHTPTVPLSRSASSSTSLTGTLTATITPPRTPTRSATLTTPPTRTRTRTRTVTGTTSTTLSASIESTATRTATITPPPTATRSRSFTLSRGSSTLSNPMTMSQSSPVSSSETLSKHSASFSATDEQTSTPSVSPITATLTEDMPVPPLPAGVRVIGAGADDSSLVMVNTPQAASTAAVTLVTSALSPPAATKPTAMRRSAASMAKCANQGEYDDDGFPSVFNYVPWVPLKIGQSEDDDEKRQALANGTGAVLFTGAVMLVFANLVCFIANSGRNAGILKWDRSITKLVLCTAVSFSAAFWLPSVVEAAVFVLMSAEAGFAQRVAAGCGLAGAVLITAPLTIATMSVRKIEAGSLKSGFRWRLTKVVAELVDGVRLPESLLHRSTTMLDIGVAAIVAACAGSLRGAPAKACPWAPWVMALASMALLIFYCFSRPMEDALEMVVVCIVTALQAVLCVLVLIAMNWAPSWQDTVDGFASVCEIVSLAAPVLLAVQAIVVEFKKWRAGRAAAIQRQVDEISRITGREGPGQPALNDNAQDDDFDDGSGASGFSQSPSTRRSKRGRGGTGGGALFIPGLANDVTGAAALDPLLALALTREASARSASAGGRPRGRYRPGPRYYADEAFEGVLDASLIPFAPLGGVPALSNPLMNFGASFAPPRAEL